MQMASNSEIHEHLQYFRNDGCAMTNHNKEQDMQANLKSTDKLFPLLFAAYFSHTKLFFFPLETQQHSIHLAVLMLTSPLMSMCQSEAQ